MEREELGGEGGVRRKSSREEREELGGEGGVRRSGVVSLEFLTG